MPEYPIDNEDRKQVEIFFRREFANLVREPRATLFHYTSGEAAAAIVDDATFRATNILYLDDGREMRHAVDVIEQAMAERWGRAADSRSTELHAIVSRYLSEVGSFVPPDVWIATFTECQDSPIHWERHTHGGHSVALGFSPTGLGRTAESGGAFLAPCCYDDEIKTGIMARSLGLLEQLYDRPRNHRTQQGPQPIERVVRYVLRQFALFGALMKRSELAWEREWRIVLVNASQTSVGARRIKATPRPLYTALHIDLEVGDAADRLPISDIVVGPSPYQQMTERAFRTLLYKHGYEGAAVILSETAPANN